MSNIIECKSVNKIFKDAKEEIQVLSNINLTIKDGEQIAIIGRSGSGKTTLLQILGALDFPTSGQVYINGSNYNDLPDFKKSRLRNIDLGFIYQFHHLLPEFTAEENIAMPLLIRNNNLVDIKEKTKYFLEKIGLSKRKDHRPAQLSGGERQRVAIARALIGKPKCVFADEPTGNLDLGTAESTFSLMRDLNKELRTSLIIVTHDLSLAGKMDTIYQLQYGVLEKI